jgi:uncharacterized protein (DUF58 family)
MAEVLLSLAMAVLVLLFPLIATAGIWFLLVAPAALAGGAAGAGRWRPRVHVSRYVNYERLPEGEESGWKTC